MDLMNPFGVSVDDELTQTSTGEPLWTEFCFFFCYDPDTDIGVSIHAGREPVDPSIWRATVGVLLPGGSDALVVKCSGRGGDRRGAGAAGFKADCVEPMRLWTLGFDGLMIRTSREALAAGPTADDVGEHAAFSLSFEGVSPMWDLRKHMTGQSWGSAHFEQICRVRGEFRVGGRTVRIENGYGLRDHSYGSRDYEGVLGNYWANALFPGGATLMAQHTVSRKLDLDIRHGYVFWNDGSPLEVVELVTASDVSNADTPDGHESSDLLAQSNLRRSQIVFDSSRGRQTVDLELLHGIATTYVAPSGEVLGTDFRKPDGLQLTESPCRFTWNGEVGYGNRERVAALRTLRA